MSDTPRTDAEFQRVMEAGCLSGCDSIAHEEKCPVAFPDVLMRDFARHLERELASYEQLEKDLKAKFASSTHGIA